MKAGYIKVRDINSYFRKKKKEKRTVFVQHLEDQVFVLPFLMMIIVMQVINLNGQEQNSPKGMLLKLAQYNSHVLSFETCAAVQHYKIQF